MFRVEECITACVNKDACNAFSFDPENHLCYLFFGCPNTSEGNCPKCVSGTTEDCLECFGQGKAKGHFRSSPLSTLIWTIKHTLGRCLGSYIGHEEASNSNECLAKCQANGSCKWFTYDVENRDCTFLEDCLFTDNTCAGCVHGQRECGDLPDEGKWSV